MSLPKKFTRLAVPALCVVLASGCMSTGGPQHLSQSGSRPSSGGFNMISKQQEAQIGRQEFAKLKAQKRGTRDRAKQRAAERVLSRLVRANNLQNAYPWEIRVFADKSLNAFALPGGKIGIFEGLFKATDNDARLAAVVAHEMAHVMARHGTQRASRQAMTSMGTSILAGVLTGGDARSAQALNQLFGMGSQTLVVLPYSRKAEFEADRIGVLYMAHGGYNPEEAITVFERLQKVGGSRPPPWLSTHPPMSQRIQQIRMNMDRYKPIYAKNRR